MQLELANDADLTAIAALVNSAYRGDTSRQGWTSEADLLDGHRTDEASLRADLAAKPQARLLYLREDGMPLACVWLEPSQGDTWYLGMLTVRPNLQDRQIGRTLLAGAEDFARRNGARRIRMTVVSIRDTLLAWYQRRGYALTGEILPFNHGTKDGEELYFAALEKAI